MKIGLCEKDLHGSLQDNMTWMSVNGLEGFQVWKGQVDASGMPPLEVVKRAWDLGLRVTAVGGGPNLVDPTKATQTVDSFRQFLDLSVALGPRLVTAESKRKPEGLSEARAWESVTRTVRQICDHAEKVDARLAIECSGGCFIADHNDFLRLQEAVGSPVLTVNMDPANIVLAGGDVLDAVRTLGKWIVHTHAKDICDAKTENEPRRDVPAGEGLVPYPDYLRLLKEIGYDGWLVIEMHAGQTDRRDEILRAKVNLARMLTTI